MAFEARSLRVQIPCGSVTLINCTVGNTINCFFPSKYCHFPSYCHYGTPWTCFWGTPCQWGSPCFHGTCGYHLSLIDCEFGTRPHLPECPGTEIVEGPITISPEHLGVLKEQLQAQLREIEIAEKAVAEAEKKSS